MKKIPGLLIFLTLVVGAVFSAPHPKKAELDRILKTVTIYNRLASVEATISKKSMEYNNLGYREYEKKNWDKAVDYFKLALAEDEKNSFAHFNLACTLALQYGNLNSVVLKEIGAHLESAANLDTYWAVKIFVDSDLDAIRHTGKNNEDYQAGGDCAPAIFINHHGDGTVVLSYVWDETSDMGPGGSVDGEAYTEEHSSESESTDSGNRCTGYYCLVGERIFYFYPEYEDRWGMNHTKNEFSTYPFFD